MVNARRVFDMIGMDPHASEFACAYLPIFAFAFYVEMLVEINRRFLQNLGYSSVPMVILMIVGGLHIFWCWLMIEYFSFGVRGSALASAVTSLTNYVLQTLYLFLIVKRHPKLGEAVGLPNKDSFSLKGLKSFMELGLPTLIQGCLENWIFDIVFLCAAWISLEAQGAVMIVIQATLLLHFPVGGLYNATVILVGRGIGAQEVATAKR